MTTSRVVMPATDRLEISKGDWLLVKRRMTAGERHDGYERMYVRNPDGSFAFNADGNRIVSNALSRLALITTYLVDWSLVGLDDKPLDIRGASLEIVTAMLRALDPDDYDEIYRAVDAHDTAMAIARAAQKKTPSGVSASSATSGLPEPAAGATNGSTNSTPTSTTSSEAS